MLWLGESSTAGKGVWCTWCYIEIQDFPVMFAAQVDILSVCHL